MIICGLYGRTATTLAIIYSLVVSCQRHRKDPRAYLRDVLRRLPTMNNQDDLASLTPANWQPA